MKAKQFSINPYSDWSKPTITNRAAAQKFVPSGTIQRFVGRSDHSDLRQGIRQYKNNKNQEYQAIQRLPFFFFSHSKKPVKTTHKPRQELKPVKNTKSYRYAEIRHQTVTFLYGRKIQ